MENATISNPVKSSADDPAKDGAPEGNRRLTICLSIGAFFVSYVLSAGPAVFIERRMDVKMISTIFEHLYTPLILIVKAKVPLISALIRGYIELFS